MPRYIRKNPPRLLPAGKSSPDEFPRRKKEVSLPEALQSDPLMGTFATAKALNITPVHLRRLCRAGKIPPPLKVGHRKLAWRLSTITKFIAEREEVAQHEAAFEPTSDSGASTTTWPVAARRTAGRRRR